VADVPEDVAMAAVMFDEEVADTVHCFLLYLVVARLPLRFGFDHVYLSPGAFMTATRDRRNAGLAGALHADDRLRGLDMRLERRSRVRLP
jgi:hypothetical protein